MAEKYSLKLKYSLKYSLKLVHLMSDSFDFFHSLFHIQCSKVIATYLGSTIIRLSYLKF